MAHRLLVALALTLSGLQLGGCALLFESSNGSPEPLPTTVQSGGLESALVRVAAQADAAGDVATASRIYARAAALAPKDAAAWRGLGRSLLALGRADEAVAPLQTAMALSPDPETTADLDRAQESVATEVQQAYSPAVDGVLSASAARKDLALSLALAGKREEALAVLRGDASRFETKHLAAAPPAPAMVESRPAPGPEPVTVNEPSIINEPLTADEPAEVDEPSTADETAEVDETVKLSETPEVAETSTNHETSAAIEKVPAVDATPVANATAVAIPEPAATPIQPSLALVETKPAPNAAPEPTHAFAVPRQPSALLAPSGLAAAPAARFQVQLASYRTPERAREGWAQLRAEAPSVLDRLEPVVVRADLGPDRGIYYRLRSPVLDSQDAKALRDKLVERRIECFIARHEAPAPEPNQNAAAKPTAYDAPGTVVGALQRIALANRR